MSILELLAALSTAGVTLSVRDDTRLIVTADKPAPIALMSEIRRHKPMLIEMFGRTSWNVVVADAWIQITMCRVNSWYADLEPGCPVDGPGWDEAAALVAAAYETRNRQALREALDAYERHAREAFDGWQQRRCDIEETA